MKIFRSRKDILPPAQQAVWSCLVFAAELGCVLYGGTAIALRLGHRQSIDFDFFTENSINKDKIITKLDRLGNIVVLQDETNAFTLSVLPCGYNTQVKISFFGDIHIGRVGEPELTDDHVLLVASLEDLLATKCKVLLQRVESKDYIDIAALIRAGVHLDAALASAQGMYKPTFQPGEALKAMVYFEGGDLSLLTDDDKKIIVDAVSRVRALPQVELKLSLLPVGAEGLSDNQNQLHNQLGSDKLTQ